MTLSMDKLKKYNNWVLAFLFLLALIIAYKSIDNLGKLGDWVIDIFKIIKPFVVGFIIAYVLNIPRKIIHKKLSLCRKSFISKRSKGISIVLVYLIAIAVIIVAVRALLPAIYSNISDIIDNAGKYIETIVQYVADWQDKLDINIIQLDSKAPFSKILEEYISSINIDEFSKYAQGVINITSGVINALITIIVSVYMLIDADRITNNIKSVIAVFTTEKRTEEVFLYFRKVNDIFSKYIYCRVVDAVIMSVISTIILSIIQVKYALLLGLLIGFSNLIPYFGAIIGSVVTVIITLVTGGIFKTIWVAVSLFVLEQIDGNYIGPKIMGEVLEVRPLWVIFAVTVGGRLFGVVGMVFSVPVMVVLKMMASDYLEEKRLKKAQQYTEEI